MADSQFVAALIDPDRASRSALLAALETRGAYVIGEAEDPQDLNAGNIQTIIFKGVVFWYDPADATTAHDGVTTLVTAEGRCFKADQINGISIRLVAVLDKDLTAPPGSPAEGDMYIVGPAATGAWATEDENIAIYTARGWVFQVPNIWDMALVVDEALFYHYDAGGDWASGIPAITIANDSISLNKLKYFKIGVAVENQTTNTPPGAPADGVAYIVGGSPTGVWVGHSLDLAIREDGAWVYYEPYEGAQLYDKNLNAAIVFNGSIWVAGVSGYSQQAMSTIDAAATITGTYVYSGTAPTTSNMSLIHEFNFTAKKAGAVVEVTVKFGAINFSMDPGNNALATIETNFAIMIDTTVNADDWSAGPGQMAVGLATSPAHDINHGFQQTFIITLPDVSVHALKLYGSFVLTNVIGSVDAPVVTTANVRMIAREVA